MGLTRAKGQLEGANPKRWCRGGRGGLTEYLLFQVTAHSKRASGRHNQEA